MKLTHWSRVTHICVGRLTIIGSDNGLSPGRRQAILWTNAGILLIGPLGTNFSELLIEFQTFSLKKVRLKMSSVKYCPIRLGLDVFKIRYLCTLVRCNQEHNGRRSRPHPYQYRWRHYNTGHFHSGRELSKNKQRVLVHWASRMKYPAQLVSHKHEIYILDTYTYIDIPNLSR